MKPLQALLGLDPAAPPDRHSKPSISPWRQSPFLPWQKPPETGDRPPRRGKADLEQKTFSTENESFVDGRILISVADLTNAGARVEGGEGDNPLKISFVGRSFKIIQAAKRAEINLAEQRLRAGRDRLVLESHQLGERTLYTCGEFGRVPAHASAKAATTTPTCLQRAGHRQHHPRIQ